MKHEYLHDSLSFIISHLPEALRDPLFAKWKELGIIKMKILSEGGNLMMIKNIQFKI